MIKKLRNARLKINRYIDLRTKSIGKQVYPILGDSHVKVFSYINQEKLLEDTFFDVLSVGGATAMGMVNPNSKTNALKMFKKKLNWVSKSKPVFIMLGEVDTGFLIWYRALKKELSVESQMDLSLKNYTTFVDDLIKIGLQKIYLFSAPLPTIPDNHAQYGEIARLRKEVKSSLKERTELTIEYNKRLKNYTENLEVNFISLEKFQLNREGTIKKEFLNDDPLDHHYNNEVFANCIIEELRRIELIK